MKLSSTLLFTLFIFQLQAQKTSINYNLNGRLTNEVVENTPRSSENTFAQFIGEWTLKDDTWIQNWGGDNDTIKIPQHHTVSNKINTANTLLSIIDGPEPNGHIFWSYNPNTKVVDHLSSFGTIRSGVGSGAFYDGNNLRLKVSFEGEAKGTYRIYTYEWINDDEYALNSIQFDEQDKPTGLFYKGNFIRINKKKDIEVKIKNILSVLDNNQISKEEQLKVYAENIVHMAPQNEAITNKKDLLEYLELQANYGYTDMKHQIIDFKEHGDIVVMRGMVKGKFYPKNESNGVPFETKNLFIFEWLNDDLKISKVIYNMAAQNQQ